MAEKIGDTATRMAEQTRRAAEELLRPVRDNPWPLALIGVGVAWFLVRSRSSDTGADDWRHGDDWRRDQHSANDHRQHEYSEYSDYRGRAATRPSWTASEVTGRLSDLVSDASRRVRDLSRDTQYRVGRMMQDNPMVLGAVALAAGAVIGTLLSRTGVEDSYMGETRDTMLESARKMAEDKVQELSQVVRDSAGTDATRSDASFPSAS